MSANLIVDLRNTSKHAVSIADAIGIKPASGVIIGHIVDLLAQNTMCQVIITHGLSQSGFFGVQFQESDTTLSGDFTAVEASGTAQWNNPWVSGGRIVVNSGGGSLISGGVVCGAFERGKRYVRAILESGGLFDATGTIAFLSQHKTTGSGAGFTMNPQT